MNCLLVRQEVFDRAIDAKGMKTEISKEADRPFPTMITEKESPQNISGRQGHRICWRVQKTLLSSRSSVLLCIELD